jgi:hypothetical protein
MKYTFFYIDPGTGSLLISLIGGAAMTFAYSLRKLLKQLYSIVAGRRYTSHSNLPGEIVFYSEGGKYWNVFNPVLKELDRLNHAAFYFTSDKNDPGLFSNYDAIKSVYIGNMNQAFHVLNYLECKILVSTTPQLNILGWKRSKNVKHYSYLMHSPIDIHSYKYFAFDYYDSILCSNDRQMRDIRSLERIRSTKQKTLFNTGCTYYDEAVTIKPNAKDFILIAPTWGERSFLRFYGIKIIRELLENNIQTKLRPHPQSWISDKETLSIISNEFLSNDLFEFDNEKNVMVSLANSQAVICDVNSGLVFDNILYNKRPVIAIDFDWNSIGYESFHLAKDTMSKDLLVRGGAIVNKDSLATIAETIKNLDISNLIDINHNEFIFNFQNAGKVAAEQILEISEKTL